MRTSDSDGGRRRRVRGIRLLGGSLLAIAWLVSAPGSASEALREPKPALHLEEGTLARSQLVALGRDLLVEGEALSDVAVVQGSARIVGSVAGDVIVLSGDVALASGARVGGDLFVLGGEITAAPGSEIEGRSVAYPTVAQAWMTLMEGPSLGADATSPVVIGAKIALVGAWLVLALVLFATAGREVVATSEAVSSSPFRNFAIGLTAVSALVLTAVFVSSFSASILGIPMLFLVGLFALLLKLWGMTAVFHAVGVWVGRRFGQDRVLPVNAATIGLLLLGTAKLLPFVGVWTWTVATLIGVGAAFATKFGRDEPWLQTA